MEMNPCLYGITNSNRSGDNLWGKNQFNSTFPVSLSCYMRDNKIEPVYLHLSKDLNVKASEISFDEVFNTKKKTNELNFSFESKYEPYQAHSHDDIGNIDLVIKDLDNKFLRPLEIKLTVLPDSSTVKKVETKWGTELILRPATTKYCALGMFDSLKKDEISELRKILEPICYKIQDWNNTTEMNTKLPKILDAIDEFQRNNFHLQKPLLMQPIWKTKGKSPILENNAFDIFIWSDYALSRLFLDQSRKETKKGKICRQNRSSLRLARFLYEASTSGSPKITKIYTEMAFDKQTDKEFSVNGCKTRKYMDSDRIVKPIITKNVLDKIILNGGEEKLSPERRFDQTVYFTISNALKK